MNNNGLAIIHYISKIPIESTLSLKEQKQRLEVISARKTYESPIDYLYFKQKLTDLNNAKQSLIEMQTTETKSR